MLKKFLLCVAIFLFAANVTHAKPISDSRGDIFISVMEIFGKQIGANFNFWGKEYYTYQGALRLEFHFGSSKNNLVRLRLNGDSVERALISLPINSNDSDGKQSVRVMQAVLWTSGVTPEAIDDFTDKLLEDMQTADRRATHFKKKYSVWSQAHNQYLTVDFEVIKNGTVDFYIYAE